MRDSKSAVYGSECEKETLRLGYAKGGEYEIPDCAYVSDSRRDRGWNLAHHTSILGCEPALRIQDLYSWLQGMEPRPSPS